MKTAAVCNFLQANGSSQVIYRSFHQWFLAQKYNLQQKITQTLLGIVNGATIWKEFAFCIKYSVYLFILQKLRHQPSFPISQLSLTLSFFLSHAHMGILPLYQKLWAGNFQLYYGILHLGDLGHFMRTEVNYGYVEKQ